MFIGASLAAKCFNRTTEVRGAKHQSSVEALPDFLNNFGRK
jgi:hypothetical protein